MKVFDIRSILSVSKGGRIPFDEGSIELLEFMTGQKLNPEQYGPASFACKSVLLQQFSFLVGLEDERALTEYWERDEYMEALKHGRYHHVAPLSIFNLAFVVPEKSVNMKKLEAMFK